MIHQDMEVGDYEYYCDDVKFIHDMLKDQWNHNINVPEPTFEYHPEQWMTSARNGFIYVYEVSRYNSISTVDYRTIQRTSFVTIRVSARTRELFMAYSNEIYRIIFANRRVGQKGLHGYTYMEVINDRQSNDLSGWYQNNIGLKLTSYNYPITSDGFGPHECREDNLKFIKDYLYSIDCDRLDYDYADEYFRSRADPPLSMCSAVYKDGLLGRNLDWLYDEGAEFVVRVGSKPGRHASLGIAGGIAKLTNEFVKSEQWDDAYKLVPFQMQDGINDAGVTCSILVVPFHGEAQEYQPVVDVEDTVCSIALVRYVLDKASSAQQIAEHIRDHVKVYFPQKLHEMGYESHYLIADANDSYLLEFVDGANIITRMDKAIVTNFHLHEVEFNEDGSVYTPATQDNIHNAYDTNNIELLGSGLERFNIANTRYAGISAKVDLSDLMGELRYTKAYIPANGWCTEFVGLHDLTVKSTPEEYAQTMENAHQLFLNRKRDGTLWQTVHSSVYDIKNRRLFLKVQEGSDETVYDL